MNIIKLRDVLMPSEFRMSEMFNKLLKGRYAYWIQMRYIVPFDYMRHEGYVACEEDITKLLVKVDGTYPKPYGCPYIDMYDEDGCIMRYIDSEGTDKANNISQYRSANDNSTDPDITISELKLFRRKLAQFILDYNSINIDESNSNLTTTEEHVLNYYADDMYNETVKSLMLFNNNIVITNTNSDCGCCSAATLDSIYSMNIDYCDALNVYRKNIYDKMVEMFSNVDFWGKWPLELLIKFKKYIDNIIKVGLVIDNSKLEASKYRDCTCNKTDINSNQNILKKLSESLNYMIEGQEKSHYNYIKDSLYNWASLLYEYMQW